MIFARPIGRTKLCPVKFRTLLSSKFIYNFTYFSLNRVRPTMQNYYEIDSIFYWQALREILSNKIGFYLYNKDIEKILNDTQFEGNIIYINLKSYADKLLSGCQFKIELSSEKIRFSDFLAYDESHEKNQLKFIDVISKFTRVKYIELLSDTSEVTLKHRVVTKVELPRKPGFSRSAPHLFDRNDPDTTQMTPKKKLSIPKVEKSQQNEVCEYDIKKLILNPPSSHSNPRMVVNLLILHSIVDKDVLEYFRFSKSILMLYVRPRIQMEDLDIEYFLNAMQIHGELKKISKEKKLGPKKAFLALFPINRQEDIQILIDKKNVEKLIDKPRSVFRDYIIKKSTIEPEFLYYAFLSLGSSLQVEFEDFLVELFEDNKLSILIDGRNPLLSDQVIRVIVHLLINSSYRPEKKIIDIYMIILTDYISTYKKLPDLVFSSPDLNILFKNFDIECARKMFLIIKKNNLSEVFFKNITERFIRQKKTILGKSILTHDFFQPFLSDLGQANDDSPVYFCMSLLCLNSFEIDLLILSEKKFESCWVKIEDDAVGSVLLSQMLERVCLEFEFSNLVTDVADARAFAFGKDLARDSSKKLDAYKSHLCLSFTEVKNAFLIEQAIKRTECKSKWLQIHKSNMQIVSSAFKPYINKHIKDIAEIHRVFKQLATKRLVSMDGDACNPDHYELSQFPKVLKVMTSTLTNEDKAAYRKGLEGMRTYFNIIEAYKTINISSNAMIGYMSTLQLVEEIFTKFPNCIKNENDKRSVAIRISIAVLDYLEAKLDMALKNTYFSTQTLENVRFRGEVLFIEGWKATELLGEIKKFLGVRLAEVNSITPDEFLLVVRESCPALEVSEKKNNL